MQEWSEILGSKLRSEIFRLLFAGPDEELHIRELARRARFTDRAMRQELAKLAKLDLVVARRDGNRVYYRARKDHPLYSDLRNITLKTSGLADVLRKAIEDNTKVRVCFVFGSVVRGFERADSDVDLMVIGSLGMRELTRMLRGVSEKVGREINPHILTPEDFCGRVSGKDHFISSVLKEPRIMVKGGEDDLKGLAK